MDHTKKLKRESRARRSEGQDLFPVLDSMNAGSPTSDSPRGNVDALMRSTHVRDQEILLSCI